LKEACCFISKRRFHAYCRSGLFCSHYPLSSPCLNITFSIVTRAHTFCFIRACFCPLYHRCQRFSYYRRLPPRAFCPICGDAHCRFLFASTNGLADCVKKKHDRAPRVSMDLPFSLLPCFALFLWRKTSSALRARCTGLAYAGGAGIFTFLAAVALCLPAAVCGVLPFDLTWSPC